MVANFLVGWVESEKQYRYSGHTGDDAEEEEPPSSSRTQSMALLDLQYTSETKLNCERWKTKQNKIYLNRKIFN